MGWSTHIHSINALLGSWLISLKPLVLHHNNKPKLTTYGAADAAVGLCNASTAAVTLVIHSHFQAVFEPHRLDGEALVSALGRTASCLDTDVEGHLGKKKNYKRAFLVCGNK